MGKTVLAIRILADPSYGPALHAQGKIPLLLDFNPTDCIGIAEVSPVGIVSVELPEEQFRRIDGEAWSFEVCRVSGLGHYYLSLVRIGKQEDKIPQFYNIASMSEDDRIDLIGRQAVDNQKTVGFIVDVENGSHAKGDRYIEKLLQKFPTLRVLYRADGPVAWLARAEIIKVGVIQQQTHRAADNNL